MPSPRSGRAPLRRLALALAAAGLAAAVGLAAPASARDAATPLASTPRQTTTFVGAPPSMCPVARGTAQFTAPTLGGSAKTVALTFDDGPGRSTQAIIDILESFHVRATFFNIGEEIEDRPWLVREEAQDGFLVGNHTLTHPDLTLLSPAGQAAELDGVIHLTRELTGTSPCVFRPPYGDYDATTLSLVQARRMSLWMWNVDTQDWMAEGSGSQSWIDRIVSNAETEGLETDHAVVLFHNQAIAMPATVAALPIVIRFFEAHGYRFVDLLGRTGWPGTCGPPGVAARPEPATALGPGASVVAGTPLASPGGQFVLSVSPHGDLSLRLATGRTVFDVHASGHPGASLHVLRSGNVVLRSAGGSVLWQTRTAGHPGAHLAVEADGDLAVEDLGHTLWSSGTVVSTLLPGERLEPGWRLTSPDGRCRLLQLRRGPLELLDATGQVLFTAGVAPAGSATVLEASGNLVQVLPGAPPSFVSGTSAHGATRVVLDDEGRLVLSTLRGLRLWVTP